MKSVYILSLVILSIAASASAYAARPMLPVNAYATGSTLAINCIGEDVGAEVLVNGEFKGECPLDVKVSAGKLQLRVQKQVDPFNDRIFEQEIRLGDDVIKKIDVTLGAAQLNLKGKQQKSKELALEGEEKKLPEKNKKCLECPEMVAIPGTNFAMAKYTVTFQDWDACRIDGGCNGYRPSDKEWGHGTRPVINVSWNHAQAYIKWLSNKTGNTYRLPTEEEWEIAARAGTTTEYYWGIFAFGDSASSINANCNGCGSKWDNKTTSPVGSFKPNGFGLYDMSGNVWQWTDSCWEGDCSKRVLRGGSWNDTTSNIRIATRFKDDVDGYYHISGFRLAMTLK
ncbi:MAG: SUMF1/EgtB/PvdO family nonheme iron enzyme [Candidatus Nitrotoga sp.]